jgi:hypothetical protein
MTWDSLSALLFHCMERGEVPRPVLVLGALGTLASIIQALFTLYRWLKQRRKLERYRAASTLLRGEGQFRATLNHRPQAMANLNMSIRLNPSSGESHYQRGLLHESLWLAPRHSRLEALLANPARTPRRDREADPLWSAPSGAGHRLVRASDSFADGWSADRVRGLGCNLLDTTRSSPAGARSRRLGLALT